jgi:PIN domain nuclease of toxin-antitoxin system
MGSRLLTLNLDTHVFLDAILGNLKSQERSLLKRHRWGISSIVLWEIEKLSQKKHITLTLDSPDLVKVLEEVRVWELSREICLALRKLDFKSDPADELIAATSIVHRAPLLTRDERILSSRIVPFA